MSPSLRVAISGGGLGGATLLHALLPHAHLDVHIFESAPVFKEAGMAIGITRNALDALGLIGPSARQCLERAGAVPMRGVRLMLAQGEKAGSMIDELNGEGPDERVTSIVHRADFLRETLAGVPQERMHASKKLVTFDKNSDGSLTLHFADGTTHDCDVLIGADGIRSTVRRLLLGEDEPSAFPRNSCAWGVMTLQPYEKAQAVIGKETINIGNAREHAWIGDGTFLMHNVLSGGQLVQLVVGGYDDEAKAAGQWQRIVPADEMRELFKNHPTNLKNAVEEPEQPGFYCWEHPSAPTYAECTVCVMGDAAHATTPWQSSGAGMSLEDALILSTLLGLAKTRTEAQSALKVYDQVRRPRTQYIVDSSRVTGRILSGLGEETGLDIEKLKAKTLPRWPYIVDFDNEKARDEAVELMKKELAS
ncbi:salicylate hydroxylase [Penicillium angulare]|uniref:salicylate hydroxylase n=1 Tax=Penicillium angulare TaxID=116970 RepID=UPI00253FC931|nr:salicylate hydroxylase [Penicillium angulare]KAJ5279594.1 salicylate hydroxylase [Penicillium angulare]